MAKALTATTRSTATMTEYALEAQGLTSLLRLVSPALPIGGYTGSEALEYAIAAGWLADDEALHAWIAGRLGHGLAGVDLPLLMRFVEAFEKDDHEAVLRWSQCLRALRESFELARQDAAMGRALASLLADLGEPRAEAWRNHECASYPAMFALAAVSWRVDREAALAGFAFAWCESQVAAAVKIVPLGQTAGQRILARLASGIADAVEGARRVKDAEIGASEPGLAIASALHETQYTRLFRS